MQPILAILNQGPEIMVVLLIILLLFGATKIPQLARSLGLAKGEFEKGKREGEREAAAQAAKTEDPEKTLEAAKNLGIPTEGRSLDDIRADIRAKMS